MLNESSILESDSDGDLDDDALLSELGLNSEGGKSDITELTHVKPRAEVSRPEEVGQRTICSDFEIFKPLFDAVQADIKSGKRKIIPYAKDSSVEKENLFIISGQTKMDPHCSAAAHQTQRGLACRASFAAVYILRSWYAPGARSGAAINGMIDW